jgi:hypothetical protein
MWKKVVWVLEKLPPLFLGVVMFASSIPPNDAVSNIGKWASLFHLQLPDAMQGRSADIWIFCICSILLLLYFIIVVFQCLAKRRNIKGPEYLEKKNETQFPLVDIEFVRVKAEPPFEQFKVGFAYDIFLHNKSNTVLSGISIIRMIDLEKNRQKIMGQAGSPLKLRPFDKRINVLSPNERKLLYREMSESYEYMIVRVVYDSDSGNKFQCVFEGDRDGLILKNKQQIK